MRRGQILAIAGPRRGEGPARRLGGTTLTLATTIWDPSERLDTPERIAFYLEAAFEDGDPAVISAALGDVARAKGMTLIARETGLSRESLYRALSAGGRPEFATVLKVLKALGLKVVAAPAGSAA